MNETALTSLDELVRPCIDLIDARHQAREQAVKVSRTLIQQCARTIRATHRGTFEQAAQLLAEAGQTAQQLRLAVAAYDDLLAAGYTQDALKEYVEAAMVYAFLVGHSPPSAERLQVSPAAFLNGLAEAASELRRAILDCLRRDEMSRSESLLAIMDEIYSLLITVDYPDALTGGLRRNTDALRGVLERTRSDVTNALRQNRLMAALQQTEEHRVKPTTT
ncbi:MAG: haloacid dehalogenase [Chloroflexaceae bacterium]|nr:haloacid dehalogenase [Chloroflexaceae bacterium]